MRAKASATAANDSLQYVRNAVRPHRVRRSREEEDWFAWMLTGDIAGRGPAHEPIVVNVRPLARIWPGALRQAMQRNAQRFNVGNGSR